MRLMGRLIHRRYGGPEIITKLSFPVGILSNFDFHYALYDINGDVHYGAETFRKALAKHKKTGLFITKIYD